jgi:hypothetical protein
MSKYISAEAEASRKVLTVRNEGFLSSVITTDISVKTPKAKSKKKK